MTSLCTCGIVNLYLFCNYSNSWSIYKTCANRIGIVLEQSYPKASVKQNPAGKPRKGSFEVSLIIGSKTIEIFSKLEIYGPQKDRDALPDPVQLVCKLVPSKLDGF